jgi:micrococcal nuclease
MAGEGPRRPVRETIPCELTRIVDGDTIECQGTGRVRLVGMDTPESGQEPYAAMATHALSALLEQATAVALERDVELRDRYGRMLAYVWADGLMVNWALVRQGFAVVLTYPPNVQYVDWFTTAQRAAREEGVGLWGIGGFDCLPRDRRRGRCE